MSTGMLGIGDDRRVRVGRSVIWSLLVGVVFVAFSATVKDVRSLANAAPWTEDPYDAFVSFAMFFVPATLGLSMVRLVATRRNIVLPVPRLHGLIRAASLILATVLVTCAASWLSVFAAGRTATPAGLLLGLGGVTGLGLLAAGRLLWAARSVPATGNVRPDWVDDLGFVIEAASRRLGSSPSAAAARRDTYDRGAAGVLRRHITAVEVAAGLAFGTIAAVGGLIEGDPILLVLLIGLIGTAGMFAFLAFSAGYLRLVAADSSEPAVALRHRPTTLAAILAAVAVPATLAFRASLWWVVGTTDEQAGVAQLAALLALIAVFVFLLARIALGLVHRRHRGATP